MARKSGKLEKTEETKTPLFMLESLRTCTIFYVAVIHYSMVTGGVRSMIAKHAGRNSKIAHSYQHRRRVHIKLQ